MTDQPTSFPRRDVLKATGATSVGAAIAGCSQLIGGGDGGDGGGGGGGGGGNGDQGQEIPDEPIKAGLQTFTQGPAAVFGVEVEAGVREAMARINEAGGVGGREIQLKVVHEGGSQVSNYESFVNDGYDVTLGPTSSGGHKSMAPVVEDAGVINMGTDGTTTSLYEEVVPDPTYSFRFQNYNTMEVIAAARVAVSKLGADNINTVAGVNPDYAYGRNEMKLFTQAIGKLANAEVVYRGWPELGASDFSTHITTINNEQPDIVFSSLWGGDSSLFIKQASANDMFANIEALVGPVIATDKSNLTKGMLQDTTILAGERNYVWNYPDPSVWPPAESFTQAAIDRIGQVAGGDGYYPSYPFMSGYGALAVWAAAAQKWVDANGTWPTQKQLARTIEHQAIYTPGGFYQMSKYGGHQGVGTHHYGELNWVDEIDFPALQNFETFKPMTIVPPEGMTTEEWISSWPDDASF